MEETTIDLRHILAMLRRQLRLIIITVISVVVLAAFVIFSLNPVYSSSALVLVDPSRKDLLSDTQSMSSVSADSARIDSEVEILRSDNVLLKVIESENLLSDPSLLSLSLTSRILTFLRLAEPPLPSEEQALSQALTRLRNSISVQRRGLTYLISVQARSGDPDQAARIANAVANAYIQGQLAAKVDSTLAARDLLQARIEDAQQAMIASDNAFNEFIDRNTALLEEDSNSEAAQIRRQIDQLEAARENSTRLAETVRTDLAEGDWDSLVASLGSEALVELQRQREELAAQLDGTDANSPVAVDLAASLANLDEQLRTTATKEVDNLQQSISTSQEQVSTLREQLRSSVLTSDLSADTLTQLYSLQQSAQLARQQYDSLMSRVQDVQTQADLQVADSRVVSPALPPLSPSFPNRILLMAIALVAATGLGIVLAFLYDNFIGGFTTEAQLGSVLRTRVGAAVPRQRAKNERDSLANLMITSPLSVFAESIRRLRATLEQSMRSKPRVSGEEGHGKMIMVCSAAPNEGKTTIALALARSYALSGLSTLLIDCDLRKPSVHRHLGIEPSQGLLEFLHSDQSDNLSSIIKQDEASPTTIIVGARRSDLPTDQLLTGPSFTRLLQAAERSFDIVVVDTPPVGPVVDSLYIAPFADAIVFVTRWASTSQADAKSAVNSLMQSKAPSAEVISVLNQQDQTRASYMRKYGDYYTSVE
jgi:capsular exopolysaccharide synthesis family protein